MSPTIRDRDFRGFHLSVHRYGRKAASQQASFQLGSKSAVPQLVQGNAAMADPTARALGRESKRKIRNRSPQDGQKRRFWSGPRYKCKRLAVVVAG